MPPNILFIMSDDHAAHAISAYGSRINQTPQIDRLAQDGVRLTNCHCTNALCTPSRATILTGQYGHITGVREWQPLDNRRPVQLQKLLKAAGYTTAIFGKWHLGHGVTNNVDQVNNGGINAGVFRYRAPLFMAAVDPVRRCLLRASEQILLPMVDAPPHSAGMGNFHPVNAAPTESWVTVGEERSQDGWRGDTLLARIRWSKPNGI